MLRWLSYKIWHDRFGTWGDIFRFIVDRNIQGRKIILEGFWYSPDEYIHPITVKVVRHDPRYKLDWWEVVTDHSTYMTLTGRGMRRGKRIK